MQKKQTLLGFWLEHIEYIDQFEESKHADCTETLIFENVSLH